MYESMSKISELYTLLQDEKSKRLFEDRLLYELQSSVEHILPMLFHAEIVSSEDIKLFNKQWAELQHLFANNPKMELVLYGSEAYGRCFAKWISNSGVRSFYFCDKKHAGERVFGKKIIPPDALNLMSDQRYIIITAKKAYNEIKESLLEKGFSKEQILDDLALWKKSRENHPRMYFEFPDLIPIPQNGAFVDAGSYDGEDAIYYSQNQNGGVLYVFEPDKANYQKCVERFQNTGIQEVILREDALGAKNETLEFESHGGERSYLSTASVNYDNVTRPGNVTKELVNVVRLDDVIEQRVSMIKMDIEGAECDALHGAKETIMRDKPFCAISVYHRKGDMLAIMDYLHSLVHDYRFWLRHYTVTDGDTVLYASI